MVPRSCARNPMLVTSSFFACKRISANALNAQAACCLNILTPKDLAEFKKKFPQYKKIPDTKLKSIIKTLNINTWKQTIENRDGVELQEGLGYLFIGSCAHPTGRNINVPLSLEHGKKLKNMNLGSDSYLAKIFYSSFASKYKYCLLYTSPSPRDRTRSRMPSSA